MAIIIFTSKLNVQKIWLWVLVSCCRFKQRLFGFPARKQARALFPPAFAQRRNSSAASAVFRHFLIQYIKKTLNQRDKKTQLTFSLPAQFFQQENNNFHVSMLPETVKLPECFSYLCIDKIHKKTNSPETGKPNINVKTFKNNKLKTTAKIEHNAVF